MKQGFSKTNNDKYRSRIQDLINDLQNGSDKERRYAAEDLGYEGIEEGIPFLVKGLEDESISVSEACADALIKIGGEDIARQIGPALGSENVRLRNHASEIMNLLGEAAVPVLIELLESEDRDVRMFAVDNLVNISSKKSIEALVKAMDDENINIAAAAALGLGKVGEDSHLTILESHLDSDIWIKCSVLQGMGYLGNPKAIDSILPLIHDEDLMVKMSSIQALAKLADDKILPDLVKIFKEESFELFGIETLNVIHEIIISYPKGDYSVLFDEELVETMLSLVQNGELSSQIKAIEILGYSNSEQVVQPLLRLVKSDGVDLRKAIVNSIIQISPKDLESLRSFLEEPETPFEQKCAALECIGRSASSKRYDIIRQFLGSSNETLPRITLDAIHSDFDPIPFEEITSLLNSSVPEIRASAAMAMGRLKSESFIGKLVQNLNDKVPAVQQAVDDALIQIGKEHEIPLLAPYLNSFSKAERKIAFEYFGIHQPEKISARFIEGLQDPSEEIRVISFKVIANLKIATLDMIQQGMNDPVDTVRVQAVRTLTSMVKSGEIASFVVQSLLETYSERIKVELLQVLAGLGEFNIVDSVLPLLNDKSSWVRIETVELIKKCGDHTAIGPLNDLLSSENDELIELVEEAIEQLAI